MLKRMIKTTAKIARLIERREQETGKKRKRTHREIVGLKRSLRHYSKLYIWGVK